MKHLAQAHVAWTRDRIMEETSISQKSFYRFKSKNAFVPISKEDFIENIIDPLLKDFQAGRIFDPQSVEEFITFQSVRTRMKDSKTAKNSEEKYYD